MRPYPVYARGKRKQRGQMNSTETKFLEGYILPKMAEGKVLAWWYERWTWALTDKTPKGKPGIRYTPDFVCLLTTGELVAFEVKGTGNARREALNRAKLFADTMPLRIYVATLKTQKQGGGFSLEEY